MWRQIRGYHGATYFDVRHRLSDGAVLPLPPNVIHVIIETRSLARASLRAL